MIIDTEYGKINLDYPKFWIILSLDTTKRNKFISELNKLPIESCNIGVISYFNSKFFVLFKMSYFSKNIKKLYSNLSFIDNFETEEFNNNKYLIPYQLMNDCRNLIYVL